MVTWESSISNSVLVCGVLGLCLSESIVQQGPLYYGLCWPLWAFNWLDRSSSGQLDATFKGYHAWESCGPCFATTSWFKWQIQEDINPNTAIYTNCHGFSVWCFSFHLMFFQIMSQKTSHVIEIPRDSQGFPPSNCRAHARYATKRGRRTPRGANFPRAAGAPPPNAATAGIQRNWQWSNHMEIHSCPGWKWSLGGFSICFFMFTGGFLEIPLRLILSWYLIAIKANSPFFFSHLRLKLAGPVWPDTVLTACENCLKKTECSLAQVSSSRILSFTIPKLGSLDMCLVPHLLPNPEWCFITSHAEMFANFLRASPSTLR